MSASCLSCQSIQLETAGGYIATVLQADARAVPALLGQKIPGNVDEFWS